MAFLEDLLERVRGRFQANDWPPATLRHHWDEIELYRLRYRNDPGLLLPYSSAYSTASFERQQQFTPIPLAREIARYSSALLFSAPATIALESNQDAVDELMAANGAEAFWQEAAELVAVEGRGGLRIIVDEEQDPDNPLITYVNEDQIIWDVRHGRFVRGGIVVIEALSENMLDTYRMLESHEPHQIVRRVYRGKGHYLGSRVPVDADYLPIEIRGFEEVEETGVDVPTLVRWDNVPGGRSDLFGIEVLLDRIDEAESLMLEKARKSRPWLFSQRALADENGNVDISNLIFLKQMEGAEYLDEKITGAPVVHVQPDMQTAEHVAYIEHLREEALTKAGYSLASWGVGDQGMAVSGTALRLKQSRTLINRQSKERMAREAMTTAIAIAMARKLGVREIADLKPEITYGDGMPRDDFQVANQLQLLKTAAVISTEEAVRELHPAWDDDAVTEEVARLKSEAPQPPTAAAPPQSNGSRLQALLNGANQNGEGNGRSSATTDTQGASPARQGRNSAQVR